MRFNSSQAPAEQERPVRTAACSRSFTAAGVTTAAPRCAPEAVHGAPSLQTMTWTNCGDFAEDEEVRDVFVSLLEKINFFFSLFLHRKSVLAMHQKRQIFDVDLSFLLQYAL